MTGRGYKLKEGETHKDWLEALCQKLNKETTGVTYAFKEWAYGFRIDCRPENLRYQVSIEYRQPRWRSDGDIGSVNVKAEDIGHFLYPKYETILPTLNRPFRVKPDGSVNIKGIHKCVTERIAAIEDYKKKRANSRKARNKHFLRLKEIMKDADLNLDIDTDRNGFSLKREKLTVNGKLSSTGSVELKLGTIYVPDEKIPAVFEAWEALKNLIK